MPKHRDYSSPRYPEREPCAGDLLVSDPRMDDSTFGRSVIYLIEHTLDGTIGVMLTKPSSTPVARILDSWAPLTAPPSNFFYGGPVQQEAGIALAVVRPGTRVEDCSFIRNVESRVYVIDLDTDGEKLQNLAATMEGARVFAGYSSWAPGQLSHELQRGDWLVVPGLPSDVIARPEIDLWATVLRRQEMPIRLLSTYPENPEIN